MDAESLLSIHTPLKERYRETPQAALITLRANGRVAEGISSVLAEGDLDFRGTLGLSRDVPVGFQEIRVSFTLDTDASEEQLATLLRLTGRYCVVYQTLAHPPALVLTRKRGEPGGH